MNNVRSAPASLIEWYTTRKMGKGRNLLQSLLSHPDMESAWSTLRDRATQRQGSKPADNARTRGCLTAEMPGDYPTPLLQEIVDKPGDYATRLFQEIVVIEQESRRPVVTRRSEDREQYLNIARQAHKLAAAIANGPLDKLAHEYFPNEAMATNGATNWGQLNELERITQAHALLPEWPPFTALLGALEDLANKLADQAMCEPRIVERASQQKANDRRLYFVRALAAYIREQFDAPLYGVVASISNAILSETLSESDVSGFVNSTKAN
ncbi:hypothetical protein [Cupriavidus taiwanensis]|uniref:hypothetical protein n=1 Tax=Cupriavidus taiwanensis TaxID=164546 RepID=UPI000E18B05E|nr:hypothetical protein [Cupriavidus taiwanensis]SPA46774.1 conserved hypothetical protein [Cupriavidus taiwanensis]